MRHGRRRIAKESPYAPWLDSQHSINGYLFCVSSAFSHLQERSALERQIAGDLLTLSGNNPHLAHLTEIRVQVRGWDDFHAELRRRFALRYRWFGDLPRGVAPLREKRFESRVFRRFLHEDSLPFFSREKYLAVASGQQIAREDEFVEDLSAEQGNEALILAGVGGVGKTRLGLELCERLAKLNWLAVRLRDGAKATGIEQLVKAHAEPTQIVLLLDYAEAADDLSAMAETVSRINDGSEHRVRLIATCRMSALSSVQDALADLTFREITLGALRISQASEIAFAEWVVRQILGFGHISNAEQIAGVCHGLPILAAFAVFLHERDPLQFNEQFGDLAGIRDFRDWVKRRLDVALRGRHPRHDEREVLQHVALIALHLPMAKQESDDLAGRSSLDASLLEMMRSDRWIEEEGGQVIATHDVFADAMVARYVFETRGVANTRLAELLRATTEQDFLPRALLAIDRIASHPDFDVVDGVGTIRTLMERSSTAVIAAHERLIRGRLVSDRGKVQLLAEYPDLCNVVLFNRDCDGMVSRLAEAVVRTRRHDASVDRTFVEAATKVLAPLLAESLVHPHPSNMVLRRAFALSPETYRSTVRARISAEPTASQTHYLLVAWLYAGLPIDEVAFAILTWLDTNARRNIKTSFVIRAWFEAGGNREPIEERVLAWIETFGKTQHATFVYAAWLNATKDKYPVEDHIQGWLGIPGNALLPAAAYMYAAWLNATKDKSLVADHVRNWLGVSRNALSPGASVVYEAWLETTKEKGVVKDHIKSWLRIPENARSLQAGFVYKSWLNVTKEKDIVEEHIRRWLVQHSEADEIRFVASSWLQAGGEFALVRGPVFKWLQRNGRNHNAVFLLKYVVREKELPAAIVKAIAEWCEVFADDEDAIWRWGNISRLHRTEETDFNIACAGLRIIELINSDRMDLVRANGNIREPVQLAQFVLFSLEVACRTLRDDPDFTDRIAAAHVRLLLHTPVYVTVQQHKKLIVSIPIVRHLMSLISDGHLIFYRDQDGLRQFADWLASWPKEDKEKLRPELERLAGVCPAPEFWARVGLKQLSPLPGGVKLENVLDKLSDMTMPASDWSWLWEKEGWKQFPGDGRLVSLGKRWLCEGRPDASWSYVWGPLIQWLPDDLELIDVAIWWLETCGPRDRGAWTFVWESLWDAGHTTETLCRLGWIWLDEFKFRQHKYWWNVWDRLSIVGFQPKEIATLAELRTQSPITGLHRNPPA